MLILISFKRGPIVHAVSAFNFSFGEDILKMVLSYWIGTVIVLSMKLLTRVGQLCLEKESFALLLESFAVDMWYSWKEAGDLVL